MPTYGYTLSSPTTQATYRRLCVHTGVHVHAHTPEKPPYLGHHHNPLVVAQVGTDLLLLQPKDLWAVSTSQPQVSAAGCGQGTCTHRTQASNMQRWCGTGTVEVHTMMAIISSTAVRGCPLPAGRLPQSRLADSQTPVLHSRPLAVPQLNTNQPP
jgi:hypothetical protein